MQQKGKSQSNNLKQILPKKFNANIALVWTISVLVSALLGLLTYFFIINPEYVPSGNYNVLSTASWLKIILPIVGILLVFFIASIITARIKIKKSKYMEKYYAWVKAEKLRKQELLRKQALAEAKDEPIILPEQEELEEEDNDVENRRVFFEQSELPDLKNMFYDYCHDNYFHITREMVDELFSAMACSRLVLVKGLGEDGLETLIELVSGFFLGNSYLDFIDEDGDIDKSGKQFFEWIKSCKKQGRLHFAGIECNNFDALMEEYGEFIPSIVSPEKINSYETFEKYGCNERFVFPQSVWCFVGIGDSLILPKDLIKNGVILNLTKTEFSGQDFASLRIDKIDEIPTSFLRFSGMINEEMGKRSLSLETWKKIDYVAEYISLANEDYFDNKICRQIERYVGFEICGGLDETKTLDRVLVNKILPFITAIPSASWGESKERLSEFLDRIFALQNLPLCEIYLTEIAAANDYAELKAKQDSVVESEIESDDEQIQEEQQTTEPITVKPKPIKVLDEGDDEGDGEELDEWDE